MGLVSEQNDMNFWQIVFTWQIVALEQCGAVEECGQKDILLSRRELDFNFGTGERDFGVGWAHNLCYN